MHSMTISVRSPGLSWTRVAGAGCGEQTAVAGDDMEDPAVVEAQVVEARRPSPLRMRNRTRSVLTDRCAPAMPLVTMVSPSRPMSGQVGFVERAAGGEPAVLDDPAGCRRRRSRWGSETGLHVVVDEEHPGQPTVDVAFR